MPATGVAAKLGDLRTGVLTFQAQQKLDAQVRDGAVKAEWSGLANAGTGRHDGKLTLTSGYPDIPVHLAGLSAPGPGTVEGLPASLDLVPGATAEFPVTVDVPASGSGEQTLTAQVSSPWQDVMGSRLNLSFTPRLDATPVRFSGTESPLRIGPLPLVYLAVGVGVASLILLLGIRLRAGGPAMMGTVSVFRDGELVKESLLEGRHVRLAVEGATIDIRGTGRGTPRLRVGSHGQQSQEIGDGETAVLRAYAVTYSSQRRRVLSIINAGNTASD